MNAPWYVLETLLNPVSAYVFNIPAHIPGAAPDVPAGVCPAQEAS